jgi:hypothetical protein
VPAELWQAVENDRIAHGMNRNDWLQDAIYNQLRRHIDKWARGSPPSPPAEKTTACQDEAEAGQSYSGYLQALARRPSLGFNTRLQHLLTVHYPAARNSSARRRSGWGPKRRR